MMTVSLNARPLTKLGKIKELDLDFTTVRANGEKPLPKTRFPRNQEARHDLDWEPIFV